MSTYQKAWKVYPIHRLPTEELSIYLKANLSRRNENHRHVLADYLNFIISLQLLIIQIIICFRFFLHQSIFCFLYLILMSVFKCLCLMPIKEWQEEIPFCLNRWCSCFRPVAVESEAILLEISEIGVSTGIYKFSNFGLLFVLSWKLSDGVTLLWKFHNIPARGRV